MSEPQDKHIFHNCELYCPACGSNAKMELAGIDPWHMARCLMCGWWGTVQQIKDGVTSS